MDWRRSFDFHSALLISSRRTTPLKTTLTSRHLPPRIAIRSFQAMNPFHFPSSTTKVSVITLLQRAATLISPSYTPHCTLWLAQGLTPSQPLAHSVLVPLPRHWLLQSRLPLVRPWTMTSSLHQLRISKVRGLNRVLPHSCSCLYRQLSCRPSALH